MAEGKPIALSSFLTDLYDAAMRASVTAFEVQSSLAEEMAIASLFLSRDGTQLVTGSTDKTARVWDAATPDACRAAISCLGTCFA